MSTNTTPGHTPRPTPRRLAFPTPRVLGPPLRLPNQRLRMPFLPTMPFQPLLPTILVLAAWVRTRDRGCSIFMYGFTVFTEVAAVAVAVTAETASEGFLVRVRAFVC